MAELANAGHHAIYESTIVWEDSTLHFDSKVWPRKSEKAKSPSHIDITVKPSALVILRPRQAEHKLT